MTGAGTLESVGVAVSFAAILTPGVMAATLVVALGVRVGGGGAGARYGFVFGFPCFAYGLRMRLGAGVFGSDGRNLGWKLHVQTAF